MWRPNSLGASAVIIGRGGRVLLGGIINCRRIVVDSVRRRPWS